MTMKMTSVAVSPTGAAGSASGTATFGNYHDGQLFAVYLDYDSNAPATTDVYLKLNSPSVTVFQKLNNATDGWWFPRYQAVTSTAAQYSVERESNTQALPLVGDLVLNVQGCNQLTSAVTAYVYVEV
jgi:hypothetical protein